MFAWLKSIVSRLRAQSSPQDVDREFQHELDAHLEMATQETTPSEALQVMLQNVDHIVRVTDREVAAAMRAFFTDTHNVVEGAGAASLAAAVKDAPALKGKRVALVATGGNVDHDVFARVLFARNEVQ